MKNLCGIHRDENDRDSHGYLEPLVTPNDHHKYLEIIDSKQPARGGGPRLTNGNRKPGLLGNQARGNKPGNRNEYSQLSGLDDDLNNCHGNHVPSDRSYHDDVRTAQPVSGVAGVSYAQIAPQDSSRERERESLRQPGPGTDHPRLNYTQLATTVPESDFDTDNELNELNEAVCSRSRSPGSGRCPLANQSPGRTSLGSHSPSHPPGDAPSQGSQLDVHGPPSHRGSSERTPSPYADIAWKANHSPSPSSTLSDKPRAMNGSIPTTAATVNPTC